MPGYASIWQDMQGYARICQDMPGYAKRKCEEHHAGNLQFYSLGHPKRKKIKPKIISKCVEKSYEKSPKCLTILRPGLGWLMLASSRVAVRRGTKARAVLFFDTLAPLGRFWMIFGTPRNSTGRQKRSKKFNTATF